MREAPICSSRPAELPRARTRMAKVSISARLIWLARQLPLATEPLAISSPRPSPFWAAGLGPPCWRRETHITTEAGVSAAGELDALRCYASSGDEEPPALPAAEARERSSTRTPEGPRPAKRARAQPLLPDADNLLEETPAGSRCPEPHQGRRRQFPHVDGDFAVLVAIPVRASAALSEQVARVSRVLAPLSASPVHAVEPAELHISLSRTFTLKRAQLVPFTDALRKALKAHRPLRLRAHAV